jgi:hypothetical protein
VTAHNETDGAATPGVARVTLAAALALSALGTVLVARGKPGLVAFASWPLAIALFLFAVRPSRTGRTPRLPKTDLLLALLLPFVPILVRVLCASPYRIHGDELITAYYSAHDDFAPRFFFDAFPQENDWVCTFPSLFFFLQRGFFAVFGDHLAQVRASALPYVWVTGFALFLAARRMLGRIPAVVSVLLYSFLTLSLYIETTGLHFVAGTAVFTAFFACALRLFQDGGTFNAAATGVVAGFCYLLYPSSFIALPVLAAFALVAWVRARRVLFVRWVLWPALGVATVLGPFLASAFTVRNYFLERPGQIWFLVESSPEVDAMSTAEKIRVLVPRNFARGVRSFWEPGLGGAGGYWYGHYPMFDLGTCILFFAGVLAAAIHARKKPEIGLALFAVFLAFLLGIALAQPPTGYHRISVVYPLIAFLLALPFAVLARARPPHPLLSSPAVRAALLALGVSWIASVNLSRFSEISMTEPAPDDMDLANWMNTRYADRQLYVAGFPGHAYRKLAYFAAVRRTTPTISAYHSDLLQSFDENRKYAYVIIFPEAFEQRFRRLDPNGRYRYVRGEWGVFVN